MDRMEGSMEVLSAMQVTADTEGLDTECKVLLHSKEVLAVILRDTVEEYKGYSWREVMGFIEADTIEEAKEVSAGRTNTQIRGDHAEFIQLNEKTSFFDVLFKAKDPILSKNGLLVNLHVDLEPQKTYKPGYPIEKRGMYYLARSLSAQLSLVTDGTDYSRLEKCYSIWICRDDVPKEERYSVSFYEMTNTKNIGSHVPQKENFDLIRLVIIRLGDKVYNGEEGSEGYDLLHFLNAIMYPHQADFMDRMKGDIDFSSNERLWQEAQNMLGLGESIWREAQEEAKEEARKEGIRVLVLDNLEEQVPKERILKKLQRHFSLSAVEAEQYYDQFAKISVE